jgi:hypothetical protein
MTSRGAALPVVLFAMALTSALVVGGMHAARTLGTRARLVRTASALQSPTERVLVDLVAAWDTAGRAAMPIGAVAVDPPVRVDGLEVVVWTTRMNERTWWLVAEASAMTPGRVQSRMALLARAADGQISPVPGPAWTRLP